MIVKYTLSNKEEAIKFTKVAKVLVSPITKKPVLKQFSLVKDILQKKLEQQEKSQSLLSSHEVSGKAPNVIPCDVMTKFEEIDKRFNKIEEILLDMSTHLKAIIPDCEPEGMSDEQ